MKKSAFEGMVEKAFLSLEARFGFKKTETRYENQSVIVRFQNDTTEILLNYEIGNTPWLEISELHHPKNKSTLGWLLVEQGVEKVPTPEQAFNPTPLKETDLPGVLQRMAKQLLQYGGELIKGDFSIMSRLQERARNYDLECQHYLSIHKSKT